MRRVVLKESNISLGWDGLVEEQMSPREISAVVASDFCFLNEVASHMEKGLLKSRYSCPWGL